MDITIEIAVCSECEKKFSWEGDRATISSFDAEQDYKKTECDICGKTLEDYPVYILYESIEFFISFIIRNLFNGKPLNK